MKMRAWQALPVLTAWLLAGCAGVSTMPTAEEKATLAPGGKLRGAFLAVPLYASKDASGVYRGVAPDLGSDLARRLGVPYEAVAYSSIAAIVAGAKSGEWDVVAMGINAERAAAMDFTAPFMEVEQGLLVRSGVSGNNETELDRTGVRFGVLEKAGADAYLTPRLKQAQIVRAQTAGQLTEWLAAGKIDVLAGTKTRLFEDSPKFPGSRVLAGRILVEPIGLAVPKGRSSAAATYLNGFVAAAKEGGQVQKAIESAGLRGVTVAPSK